MAIQTGSKVSVTLTTGAYNLTQMMVWSYNVLEIIGTPTAADYATAWWNHVKTAYRALAATGNGAVFRSVKVLELGNRTGEYGEYAIPSGEQTGTRTNPSDADADAPFVAAGVRLTVAARYTRPGQKRFPFLMQQDTANGVVGAAYSALLVTLMNVMVANITLGAPAAGVVLVPNVVGLNPDGTIRASQLVTGYAINPYTTSQVSRKFGRGV